MSISIAASNVMWGVLFVYIARKVIAQADAEKVVEVNKNPVEMKDVTVGSKGPDVAPRGPFASWL